MKNICNVSLLHEQKLCTLVPKLMFTNSATNTELFFLIMN
jgi:hypothetical protein